MFASLSSVYVRSVIRQTLEPISLWSANAEELLLATCANESDMGALLTQFPYGPGRGWFQDEAEDFNDLWTNYLAYHATLAFQVRNYNSGKQGTVDDLVNNNPYAVCIARIHYLRAPGELPPANDIEQIWGYYKQHYNTPLGKATHDEFVAKYKHYVLETQ